MPTSDPVVWLQKTHLDVVSRTFRLRSGNLSSSSMLTNEPDVAGPVVQRWVAGLTWPAQKKIAWREKDGLIARARGMRGSLRVFDPNRRQPLYNDIVNKTVETFDDDTGFTDGSGFQSGPLPPYVAAGERARRGDNSLVLAFPDGFDGLAAVLRTGDLFEVRPNGIPAAHGHLYIVTYPCNTDASGRTRAYFEPPLRTGVAAGDQVVLTDPTTVFRLASDDEGEIDVSHPNIGHVGLSLTEVLPRS